MANINKYWLILEALQFPLVGAPKDITLSVEERLNSNLKTMQQYIKFTPEELVQDILRQENLQELQSRLQEICTKADNNFLYCLYSFKMLLEICKNSNFSSEAKEDLVSEKHKSLIISSLTEVASLALQENLQKTFYKEKGGLFKRNALGETNLSRLEFSLEIISQLIYIKPLHVGKSLDEVHLWYMAAIFSILLAYDAKEYHLELTAIANLQSKLQKLWLELPKKLYYRNLMLLFSILPNNLKQRVHREMLLRLWSPGGFLALLYAMAESQRSEEQSLDEMVANLVGQPQFSLKAQQSLIKQILQFLNASLKNKELSGFMGAAILSLRKLYDNKTENKDFINKWLENTIKPLIEVEQMNLVAMEWIDFVDLISLLYHIFCTSSITTLPSDLITHYLPLFMDLHCQLEGHVNQETLKNHLQSLILKILNNRSKEELKYIVESVALKTYPPEWFPLHSTIQLKENPLNLQELKLSQVSNEKLELMSNNQNHLSTLIVILKKSNYNLLIYQHFIILLQLVPSVILDSPNSSTTASNFDLLQTEEDIYNKILRDFSQIYESKFQIIKALETLVQYQPLKTLINDNILELLKTLQDILTAHVEMTAKVNAETEINSAVLMILLILIREIIENSPTHLEDLQNNLFKPLKQLESQLQNENLKYQIRCLLKILKGEETFTYHNLKKNDFEEARSLIEANESYLQVEGIEKMIKLLNKREEFAVSNCHLLTALALNTLKSPESYTFLNCVRLFVSLVNVNESEVLELLADEYLNEAAAMDYRLVIGEAILKTSRELGPLCYKYKSVLLNAFMSGCRSPLDEFRFSAFSNLAQMCRLLTYQVHNYFQELLNLIDCELSTGKYLPAKRAAVMVLSDLLSGMDNLFDYEEMLLPIYRLLKYLVNSEQNDEKIRLHASNGLKCLSEKCQELFRNALEQQQQGSPLTKEIKIMGIHDKPKRNLKSHILEMN
ncbi:transport and Golgi organization protein 6 [Lucilia sericata]|uniref:transport and Golgi organization protein 6 n=1 Tax=Lucilia sericata TaxID=13632 RepID=UPI0018A87919|nr:transport and Golgi organization protein 6 [Lucilia sericata]